MPRYIIEREMPGVKKGDELAAVARKSNEVIASMGVITWVKSYISEAEGKIYCEYDAPNPEAVLEHARRVGIPANRISEIAVEVNPAMFM
jgi:hypothetical protein